MKKYVLAIDAGTTSSRAVIFDKKGTQILFHSLNLHKYFQKNPGLNMIQ